MHLTEELAGKEFDCDIDAVLDEIREYMDSLNDDLFDDVIYKTLEDVVEIIMNNSVEV